MPIVDKTVLPGDGGDDGGDVAVGGDGVDDVGEVDVGLEIQ